MKKWLDIIFWLVLVVVIAQRVPSWVAQYKLQGQVASALPDSIPKGKKQILVFWATWCGPCKVELARLKNAADAGEIPADAITLISVGEEPELVQKVVSERHYPFRSLLDPQGKLAHFFKVAGTPTVVFLDQNNKINWVTTGLSPSLIWRAKGFMGLK